MADRKERTVTVSGKDGYFSLLPEEQKAYRIEVFFSATNLGVANYFNYEWYKERTLYGRFKFARGEYTLKERLVQYQNECIYTEEATLSEIVKRLQCVRQEQYKVNKFVVESLVQIGNASNLALSWYSGGSAYDEIPPQPIGVPGLQVDGIYYQMFPGCAGKITLQTWYDEDVCKDVNGNPLTRDNRGKPPEPAVAGRPPTGNDSNVPAPTFPTGSDYHDPNPGNDVPTDTLDNPIVPNGINGTLYTARFRDAFTATGEVRSEFNITVVGQYSSLIKRDLPGGTSVEWIIYSGIGNASNPAGTVIQVGSSGKEPNGSTTITISLLSIVPQ